MLPDLLAAGGVQMALDAGLLQTVESVLARRYTWSPPALSLGKFQHVTLTPELPFDVVRRPSGGCAVLHGEDFEWSFAVAFPAGTFGDGPGASVDLKTPYALVAGAFAGAFEELGVFLDGSGAAAYRRSSFCFATIMRHDLMARGEKIVAIAQARDRGRVLVHGSVLERRPSREPTQAAETLLGEPWVGDGLAGGGYSVARDTLWRGVLARLEAGLRAMRSTQRHPSGTHGDHTGPRGES